MNTGALNIMFRMMQFKQEIAMTEKMIDGITKPSVTEIMSQKYKLATQLMKDGAFTSFKEAMDQVNKDYPDDSLTK